MTIRSAPASIASAALAGVTVRQVISFVTFCVAMADQQPDVVPLLGQSEGGDLFEKRGDGGDGGHGDSQN